MSYHIDNFMADKGTQHIRQVVTDGSRKANPPGALLATSTAIIRSLRGIALHRNGEPPQGGASERQSRGHRGAPLTPGAPSQRAPAPAAPSCLGRAGFWACAMSFMAQVFMRQVALATGIKAKNDRGEPIASVLYHCLSVIFSSHFSPDVIEGRAEHLQGIWIVGCGIDERSAHGAPPVRSGGSGSWVLSAGGA